MIYGIIPGICIIAGSLFGNFWWGLLIGLAIDLIVFLWNKGMFGTIRTHFQKPATTAPATATPVTPTGTVAATPEKPLPWMKIIGGAILIALFVHFYTGHGFLGLGGYVKTFEVGVRNYDDQKVCGLPNGGGMKFKIPHPFYVTLQNGTSRSLAQDVLINDTIQGEAFEVKDGCVAMTLSRILEFKGSPNATIRDPQRFRITFYR